MACPTQRSALTAATVLALVLATARGFVLGTARCHHHCNAHPLHPVTTATAATHRPSSRATRRTASRPPSFSLVPLSPSSMCFAGSPAAVTHQASSPFSSAVNREIAGGNDALRPSCRPEVIAGSRTTATMGLGLASCLMPGTGRKVWCASRVVLIVSMMIVLGILYTLINSNSSTIMVLIIQVETLRGLLPCCCSCVFLSSLFARETRQPVTSCL